MSSAFLRASPRLVDGDVSDSAVAGGALGSDSVSGVSVAPSA